MNSNVVLLISAAVVLNNISLCNMASSPPKHASQRQINIYSLYTQVEIRRCGVHCFLKCICYCQIGG